MRFSASHAVFLLALASLSFAAANDSTPPEAPNGSGLLFCRAVFSNGTVAAGAPLIILAVSNSSQTVFRLIADSTGGFVLPLSPSQYAFDALIDYPESGGIDYASTVSSNLAYSSNATFVFYPAGSVSGKALSGGKPAANATVRVACPSPTFDYSRINGGASAQTGEAGEFIFKALPAGSCIISAHSGAGANSAEAAVEGGKSKYVQIELSPPAPPVSPAPSPQQGSISTEIAVAALAVIAIAAFLLSRKKPEPGESKIGKPERNAVKGKRASRKAASAKEGAAINAGTLPKAGSAVPTPSLGAGSEKAKAVLSTLSEREGEIVRHLLSVGGKAKRSSLQHKLLIPKTSLLRNLRSLERKNIVKLTPFGRNLLAELNRSLF